MESITGRPPKRILARETGKATNFVEAEARSSGGGSTRLEEASWQLGLAIGNPPSCVSSFDGSTERWFSAGVPLNPQKLGTPKWWFLVLVDECETTPEQYQRNTGSWWCILKGLPIKGQTLPPSKNNVKITAIQYQVVSSAIWCLWLCSVSFCPRGRDLGCGKLNARFFCHGHSVDFTLDCSPCVTRSRWHQPEQKQPRVAFLATRCFSLESSNLCFEPAKNAPARGPSHPESFWLHPPKTLLPKSEGASVREQA